MKKVCFAVCLPLLFFACKKDKAIEPGVIICSQVWMAKNLDVSTYRNGDPIPEIQDYNDWINATTGAWCWYRNDTANVAGGKLYNWYAVNDARGLAPKGWHIPSSQEWTALRDYVDTLYKEPNNSTEPRNLREFVGSAFGLAGFSTNGRYTDIYFEPDSGFTDNYPTYIEPNRTIQCWTNDAGCKGAFTEWIDFGFPMLPKQTGMTVRCVRD